jgi:hypothetical protein
MKTSIVTNTPPPNLLNKPDVQFQPDDFSALIYQKGLDLVIEKATSCPCRSKENGSPQSNCQNCCGTGWVLYNPNQTRMVLQAMNLNTKYKEWSKENIGTMMVSSMATDVLGFMDRLTVKDSESVFSQVLFPYVYSGVLFAFTIYDIIGIEEIFLFQDVSSPLIKLNSTQYSFEGNKIVLDNEFVSVENLTISVRYKHFIQYHIIDLVKEVRNSKGLDDRGYETTIQMPFHAIARRSHYILDRANYENNNGIDNSYIR